MTTLHDPISRTATAPMMAATGTSDVDAMFDGYGEVFSLCERPIEG